MGTKAIEAVVSRTGLASRETRFDEEVAEALNELAAMRKAAATLVRANNAGGVSMSDVSAAWDTIRSIAEES